MEDKVNELVEGVAMGIETHICAGCDKSGDDCDSCVLSDMQSVARTILSHPDLALVEKPQVICDALQCSHLKSGVDKEDGEWVTCNLKTPDSCPYSKEFCKGWYHCQNVCGYRKVIPLAEALKEGKSCID